MQCSHHRAAYTMALGSSSLYGTSNAPLPYGQRRRQRSAFGLFRICIVCMEKRMDLDRVIVIRDEVVSWSATMPQTHTHTHAYKYATHTPNACIVSSIHVTSMSARVCVSRAFVCV